MSSREQEQLQQDSQSEQSESQGRKAPYDIIDVDIHNTWNEKLLAEYLPEPWRTETLRQGRRRVNTGLAHFYAANPETYPTVRSKDALVESLFDAYLPRYVYRYGILTGSSYNFSALPNPDYAAALARAYNDLTLATEEWYGEDPRFRYAIWVTHQDPLLAAKEIDRLAGHPKVVVVMMPAAARLPFGQRHYYPIYEAAEHHGLPVAIHPAGNEGGGISNPPSSAGYPTTMLEWHTTLPHMYMGHLVSLLCEGVFERFPKLKFGLIEGGVSWLPHVLWRIDMEYKSLRRETPWIKRRPSEYVYEHVRFGTQPLDEPPNPRHLRDLYEIFGADRLLMYASDLPHYDFDPPNNKFLQVLPDEMQRRIFYDNAAEFYGFPKRETFHDAMEQDGEALDAGA